LFKFYLIITLFYINIYSFGSRKMEVTQSSIGDLIIEGKTKKVFQLKSTKETNLVYVLSKDRITAGDGVKSHEMTGKSILSTQTNCALFEYLSAVGVKTHFVSRVSDSNPDSKRAFVAKNCGMIPIEWVARRVATGSYLKRNPHVKEGYRFAPLKLETFFKDDANHDPYWSIETIIEAKLNINGLVITEPHVKEMLQITNLVFELLERVWQTLNHSLIDMKIEFGVVDDNGVKSIIVADVIDNDSWRLWPNGDKKLMLDKQVYRNMDNAQIDDKALNLVKANFEVVAQRTQQLFTSWIPPQVPQQHQSPVVAIGLGSVSDTEYATTIKTSLAEKYGITAVDRHVSSAHKGTQKTLEVVAKVQQWPSAKVIIACAGMSNGLGPVMAGNTTIPVLNCPPVADIATLGVDVWSSLRMPSGMGCATIIGAENAALSAAHIVANDSPYVWSRIRTQQAYTIVKLLHSD
jgi:phosphoribosylaminoimidazole carboxylase/phosphoribosylaminoimidazole-succinocarboxamide synthase